MFENLSFFGVGTRYTKNTNASRTQQQDTKKPIQYNPEKVMVISLTKKWDVKSQVAMYFHEWNECKILKRDFNSPILS